LRNRHRTELIERLPTHLAAQLARHPYADFIAARASQKAEEGLSINKAVEEALEEFHSAEAKSWAGFLYALGGGVLSVGLGAWIAARYFADPPFDLTQQIPFIILSVIGFLLIFAGRFQE
jgi:hypothetical protein